jgi:hypothetical protein
MKTTYSQCIPGTNERVCWSRPGRVWTEPEVQELVRKVSHEWITDFGQDLLF